MSKILFIGDPHLKINNFEQSITLLRWIEKIAEEKKPDIVCNLGDTFDTHAVVRSELLSEFNNHVKTITSRDIEYWYVLGNHDQYKPKDAKYHALQTINIKGFRLFDKVTELDGITIVPYVQKFEDFPLNTQRICITHNTFIGADYGFKREDCGIDAEKVSANIIISGHIHGRQHFGKVVYPGTPFASSISDVDQVKGIVLFNTETLEQEFIEAPFMKWSSISYEIDANNDFNKLHSLLESKLDNKDTWVIKINGPKVEMAAYLKSKPFILLTKDKKIIIKATPNDKNKQKVQIKATSIESIMKEYVEKVYDGSLDKQLILQKTLKVLSNTK